MVNMAPRIKRGLLFHQGRESTLIDAAKSYTDGVLSLDDFQDVIRENSTDYSKLSLEIVKSKKASKRGFFSFLFS